MNIPPFREYLPRVRRSAAVFASPHSGRAYSSEFVIQSKLAVGELRASEDAFVDRLFDAAPALGSPLICGTAPRAFVDLNRRPDELDPDLIDGVKYARVTPRACAGFGVIPRVAGGGESIYSGKLSRREVDCRMARYYYPYHLRLGSLLRESLSEFGTAILFDCHSMPHESISATCHAKGFKPEVVLGDRFGKSCAPSIVAQVHQAFSDAGFKVGRNSPFSGAYVAQKYGRPGANQHMVQIEVDRALYLDERTARPNDRFDEFRLTLGSVVERLVALGRQTALRAAE